MKIVMLNMPRISQNEQQISSSPSPSEAAKCFFPTRTFSRVGKTFSKMRSEAKNRTISSIWQSGIHTQSSLNSCADLQMPTPAQGRRFGRGPRAFKRPLIGVHCEPPRSKWSNADLRRLEPQVRSSLTKNVNRTCYLRLGVRKISWLHFLDVWLNLK